MSKMNIIKWFQDNTRTVSQREKVATIGFCATIILASLCFCYLIHPTAALAALITYLVIGGVVGWVYSIAVWISRGQPNER